MTRFTRALAVVVLAASLLALPAVSQASPRIADDRNGSVSLLVRLWERISSLWGAGGGSLDPSGVVSNPPVAAPAPVVERPASADAEHGPSTRLEPDRF